MKYLYTKKKLQKIEDKYVYKNRRTNLFTKIEKKLFTNIEENLKIHIIQHVKMT